MDNAIRPTEADQITFYGQTLTAVRLPDGRIAAAFNDLCNAIGISMSTQLRRVRGDDTLSDQLITALVDSDGSGERPTNVLTASAIPLWLTGIQALRISLEKRDAIRAFKREAADALYRHFSQPQEVAWHAPTTLVPSEPMERLVAPPEGAAPGTGKTGRSSSCVIVPLRLGRFLLFPARRDRCITLGGPGMYDYISSHQHTYASIALAHHSRANSVPS